MSIVFNRFGMKILLLSSKPLVAANTRNSAFCSESMISKEVFIKISDLGGGGGAQAIQ